MSVDVNDQVKGATPQTAEINRKVYDLLDFEDRSEFDNARRGLIAAPEELHLVDPSDGTIIWSQKAYDFLDADAPDTANPSLWRNAQLNHIYGLFEVCDGIYQVRGYDMSNITFIRGEKGWIVFDPLMTVECAQAAKDLVFQHLGERPITGVLSSHTHVDHYGGIRGIVDEEDITSGRVPYIAPMNFEKYVMEENVFAGTVMARRAGYQYGTLIAKGPRGQLSVGIGQCQSKGTISYISPNTTITDTGQELVVDGVRMVFQMTPGTEAPAEMNTWLPDFKALWVAENCVCSLHNLYTLRGAQVRDGNAWAKYLMETLALYGDQADVMFQSHNWPHWGRENIKTFLLNSAAMYKFINDQTLLYANAGYTPAEISRMIELPRQLERVWYTRQYYGTLSHDAKAVYQKFLGWYDSNPVHLNELTPEDQAHKFVEYLGDVDEVLRKAKADFERGEYQWVAQITNILVFDDPSNTEARLLCADALEQLGYQSESGPWRCEYLTGALELRHGMGKDPWYGKSNIDDTAPKMSTELMLDFLGILVDSNKAQGLDATVNLVVADRAEEWTLTIRDGVLLHSEGLAADPDATWTTAHMGVLALASKNADLIAKAYQQEGDTTIVNKLADAISPLSQRFNIVEP